MIAIQMLKFSNDAVQSELSLVQAVGGSSYKDTSGQVFHVFNSIDRLPIYNNACKIDIKCIPSGWEKIIR